MDTGRDEGRRIAGLLAERALSLYGARLRRVLLFGSRARGDHNLASDVDVLVVLDRVDETERRYGSELRRAAAALGRDEFTAVTVVPIAESDLVRPDGFLRRALADAVDVTGPGA